MNSTWPEAAVRSRAGGQGQPAHSPGTGRQLTQTLLPFGFTLTAIDAGPSVIKVAREEFLAELRERLGARAAVSVTQEASVTMAPVAPEDRAVCDDGTPAPS